MGDSVAIGNTAVAARIDTQTGFRKPLKAFFSRYFYFCMTLFSLWIVVFIAQSALVRVSNVRCTARSDGLVRP